MLRQCKAHRVQILIFKRYSIYRLYGDRPSYYTVERVEKFTENMSNAGVAVKTDIPYWLTKSGIKLFNGADMQLLDGGQNYLCSFIDTIKTVSQSKAFTANSKLYFTCRVGSTGTYDDSVITKELKKFLREKGIALSERQKNELKAIGISMTELRKKFAGQIAFRNDGVSTYDLAGNFAKDFPEIFGVQSMYGDGTPESASR